MGGTGKTPVTDQILKALYEQHQRHVCGLSRGYGRKTRGFRWVQPGDLPSQSGDEPLLLKNRAPDRRSFAVCENRVTGIEQILKAQPKTQAVVLDDAFQHLSLRATRYLLLTTWSEPFFDDATVPVGRLREGIGARHRAHAIMVTHTPTDTSATERRAFAEACRMHPEVPIIFSRMAYTEWRNFQGQTISAPAVSCALLVSGIARPEFFRNMVAPYFNAELVSMSFADHHAFSPEDIVRVARKAAGIGATHIITTEKDFFRLRHLPNIGLWDAYAPFFPLMEMVVLEDYQAQFNSWLHEFVDTDRRMRHIHSSERSV